MLKEGDKAPTFNLESDTGERVSLRDFAGKTLVLYFYPRDNTPGCTRQAQAFTAARRAIEKAGGAVVGVSRDSLKSHRSFREKCGLGITLLSDPDLSVHKAYGAWGTKTMYGKKIEGVLRSTFLVENGKIVRVFPNVKVDGHADAVLEALGTKGAGDAARAKA
ncbi:MAG TPA: peroxiredoxin, partial [Labilithrix sp.]|nr:peroxiredoxin [Labilithrix sp.]